MDSFLPRLRSCSYNRNQLVCNYDSKTEKDEVIETHKDIRRKVNSDKASYNVSNFSNATCHQYNIMGNGPSEFECIEENEGASSNTKRTASVGRKRIMTRQDANSNSNQLFRMLSTQKSQEVKSIESQRCKIQDRIHSRNSTTQNNNNNINNNGNIHDTSIGGSNGKQNNQTLNSILKNSFLKYPHQVGPNSNNTNSSSTNNNNNQSGQQMSNPNYFYPEDTCKVNGSGHNSNQNNINNENMDQVYQYYTGFESETNNNQCPPINNKNQVTSVATATSLSKNLLQEQKSTGKSSHSDVNEFLQGDNSNAAAAIRDHANSSSTASSRNEMDGYQQQFCSSQSTSSSHRYHQHKFISSVERNHQNKICSSSSNQHESTPPKEAIGQFYENQQLNSCSRTRISLNKMNQHNRSISQNYHLYNPNAACIKIINNNSNLQMQGLASGNNNSNNNTNYQQGVQTATVSPSVSSNKTAAGVFFNAKLNQNNQLATQTLQDSIEVQQQIYPPTKRVTVHGNCYNDTISNYQSANNEPSCERIPHQERMGQKSVVMKIGKKMIKILNPYKNITESKGNNNSNEQVSLTNNNNHYKVESVNNQNNTQLGSTIQGTPQKSIINNLDCIEEAQKVEDQNTILNQDQQDIQIPSTPSSKLKQNPFSLHYNQIQSSKRQKDKISDLNKKLDILNMNIKKRQVNNNNHFNSEKTTDSSSKENEINTKNSNQNESNEENTQEEEDNNNNNNNNIREKKQSQQQQVESTNNQAKQSNNLQLNKGCNVNKKYLIVKQNKFINQCFQSPFLKPTTVPKKRYSQEQQQVNSYKLNDIMTIMSESQDSFNLDDQMSVIGGNCNNPSLASTIKSIVQEMAV